MDYAFAAGAFFVLERAFVKSRECICFKFDAFRAQFAVSFVVVFAVDFYHVCYGLFFAFHSFMFWVRLLWLHVESELCKNKQVVLT